ncbi:MAG: GNAT family N-acetyltransferase [Anaerolineae bacterium]
MEPRVLRKSEVDLDRLAELTYVAMKTNQLLAEEMAEEAIRNGLSERIPSHCHDWVLTAESNGKIVGWFAFYEMSDSGIAQIWEWHPVVFPDEHENQVAHALIQRAVSHLGEIGLDKVTIDFRVTESSQSCFTTYLAWYSQAGIAEIVEETFYRRDLPEEALEVLIPDEYSLGYVSETALDDLFSCWLDIFSSSSDQFFLSLDAQGRRDLFFDSWSREKPLVDEASLTLHHKGELIGFIRLLPIDQSTEASLAPIGILPEYRRKYLARELLKMSMRRLNELNYQTVSCYVSTSNSAAVSFYENLGFVSKHRITSLFGEIS